MVLCFSATGNSRLAAQVLAGKLGDELVSLNEVFNARKEWAFRSEAPYVLVAPIYAWRLPKQVEAFLKRARLLGNRQIYVLATMGQSSGAAWEYCKAAVEGNGMAFMGFQGIVMPDNYMVSYPMPSREEAASIIKSALPVLAQAAAAIQRGEPLPDRQHSPVGRLLSGPVNWSFNRFMANSRSFRVSDACVQCGKCVRECPANNIALEQGTIVFGTRCMFCLGCIHKCPVHAIDYKGRGRKNGYYTCPSLEEVLP